MGKIMDQFTLNETSDRRLQNYRQVKPWSTLGMGREEFYGWGERMASKRAWNAISDQQHQRDQR